jgi:hypothetical protein
MCGTHCAICLQKMNAFHVSRCCMRCSAAFHSACISRWHDYEPRKTCPVCRYNEREAILVRAVWLAAWYVRAGAKKFDARI